MLFKKAVLVIALGIGAIYFGLESISGEPFMLPAFVACCTLWLIVAIVD